MKRPLLLCPAALAVALAGCSAAPDFALSGLAPAAGGAVVGGVSVPAERALASLPSEAGRVVSVVERRGPGTIEQTVTLAGDPGARGDDHIRVKLAERRTLGVAPRVDAEAIEAEMAEVLPDAAMAVSPKVIVTASGPLGVATGVAADGRECLYAWSNGEIRRPASTGGVFAPTFAASTADLSVRVRLCRRGTSEERLVALAERLRFAAEVPVVSAAGPVVAGDALATAGYAAADPVPAAPRHVERPSVEPAAAPHRATAAKKPTAKPVENAAIVPMPASGG